MYHLTSKLLVYRNIDDDSILFQLADIFKEYELGNYDKEEIIEKI